MFPLASVTKVFTATAVYLLVQEGKLRLDDKVTQFLPRLPNAWGEISVLNCLTTPAVSQISSPARPPPPQPDWIAASTGKKRSRKASALPLLYKPGEKSSYNQTEFFLLKMIVEKVSGMSLEDFLTKRIFSLWV